LSTDADTDGMNTFQTSKLRMAQATVAITNNHEPAWQSLPAFAESVEELESLVTQIVSLAETQQSSPTVASAEKTQAFQALVNAAYETAAAVHACAVASSNQELAKRLDFSRSDVGEGSDSRVVSRCQGIHSAATENLDSLADYGVTTAKLTALKKRIETFQTVATKPRQTAAAVSAATRQLENLFTAVDTVLKKRMDKLAVQFKESQPAFYNEYRAARRMVRTAGSRSTKETNVVPAPNTVPDTKVA
jgi:hypothetical protein